MTSEIIDNILKRINPELVNVLATQLSGTELNSILLEVFNQKTSALTPPELLNQYQKNRFVKPADLPVLKMKRMELDILELFERHSFPAIELSPVAILGSCSVVGPVNQKKVLSALRGTEVIADSTNAIALHACDLKQRNEVPHSLSPVWMRCCNIQRHLRTQVMRGKGFRPHFKIGCLVTCGTDSGNFEFEKVALYEHLRAMKHLFSGYFKVEEVSFRLLPRAGYANSADLLSRTAEYLKSEDPGIRLSIVEQPANQNQYYKGIQYKVDIRVNGEAYEIGDGGFVDWTQQLLQNKKERMLSTGFGLDLMYRILSGEL